MAPGARQDVRRAVLIVVAALLAGGVAAICAWTIAHGIRQGVAIAPYNEALAQSQAAEHDYREVGDELAAQVGSAEDALRLSHRLTAAASDGLVGPAEKSALVAASDRLTQLVGDAQRHAPTPAALENYSPEALREAAAAHRADAEWYRSASGDAQQLSDDLATSRSALDAAAASLFASGAAIEPSLEGAFWVATIDARLAARSLAAELAGAGFDDEGVEAMEAYAVAVKAMEAAHHAELATFEGPLYDNRVAALAFANSISGGVLIEFDWVSELFGFGSGYGMAAQASLEGQAPNFHSTITLTDNVAARWGDGGPEGIIAHEVGHAITMKCWDIFEASAGGDYEAFATAWAIGMGYTSPSNGSTAYGRPSDELIAATMSCR